MKRIFIVALCLIITFGIFKPIITKANLQVSNKNLIGGNEMTQTYKVQVSMNQAHLVESGIVWKQGDFGFNLEIEVMDFDTSGVTPQIIFRKSAGAVESTLVTQSSNKFTYTIRGTELDTPGPGICDLKLKNSTTQRISTASFKFFVVPDTEDGLNEQASSYSDTIEQIVGGFEGEVTEIKRTLYDACFEENTNAPVSALYGKYISATGAVSNSTVWASFSNTNLVYVGEGTQVSINNLSASLNHTYALCGALYTENTATDANCMVDTIQNYDENKDTYIAPKSGYLWIGCRNNDVTALDATERNNVLSAMSFSIVTSKIEEDEKDIVSLGSSITTLDQKVNTSFLPRQIASASITSMTLLRDMGIYNLESSIFNAMTDKPTQATAGTKSLYTFTNAFNGSYINQYLVDVEGTVFYRIISNSGEIYKDWKNVSIQAAIDEIILLQNELAQFINGTFSKEIQELPIEYESTQGYYAFGRSTFISYANVFVSKLIPVASKSITFSGGTWANVPALVYYDINLNNIGTYPASRPSADTTVYTDEQITLPDDVAYIRIHNIHNKISQIPVPQLSLYVYAPYYKINGSYNKLYGKKLVTAGDSYTEGTWDTSDYYDSELGTRKTYGWYIAKRNNMKFVNAGISGSTMAATTQSHNPFSVNRYQAVPADTDYLLLFFGINDEAYSDLGEITDNTNATFYGAWNVVLNYYLTNYPLMHIGIICYSNTASDYERNYRPAIREIGKKWGIPVMDWCGDPTIPALFNRESDIAMSSEALALRKSIFGWSTYNAHPSPQAHEWMSTFIEDFVRSL